MIKDIIQEISNEVRDLKKQGLYKSERIMSTPQSALISTKSNVDVLNLCANNFPVQPLWMKRLLPLF